MAGKIHNKIPHQKPGSKLPQSTTNKDQPYVAGAAPKGAKAPHTRPNVPGKVTERRVIVTDAKGHRQKTGSTFTAPRKNSMGGVTDMGYTRMGMDAGGSTPKGDGNR